MSGLLGKLLVGAVGYYVGAKLFKEWQINNIIEGKSGEFCFVKNMLGLTRVYTLAGYPGTITQKEKHTKIEKLRSDSTLCEDDSDAGKEMFNQICKTQRLVTYESRGRDLLAAINKGSVSPMNLSVLFFPGFPSITMVSVIDGKRQCVRENWGYTIKGVLEKTLCVDSFA